jgi:hypothetical protein
LVTPSPQPQTVQKLSEPPKITTSSSKNTQIMLGVGLAALIIIIIAAASVSGVWDNSPSKIDPNQISNTPKLFSIQTDLSSYKTGDIVIIQNWRYYFN